MWCYGGKRKIGNVCDCKIYGLVNDFMNVYGFF